jgi:hypothetical protein
MMQLRHVVALTLLFAPNLAAADRIKVAVVPGVAVNLDAARVDALSQDMAEALAAELDIDTIGGLEVRRLLPPEGLPADCITKPACTSDVAKRTGATQLLFVVMVDSGGPVQIDSEWIDAESGRRASRPAIDLTSTIDEAAKQKFETVALQLLPEAPVRPKPKAGAATLKIDTQMTKGTPRHLTPSAIGTAGLTGLGLAIGLGFGLETKNKYNSCAAAPTVCTSDAKDTIRRDGITADVGFLVATGAAIATVVLYVTSYEPPHVIIAPMSDRGAGVSWSGRF